MEKQHARVGGWSGRRPTDIAGGGTSIRRGAAADAGHAFPQQLGGTIGADVRFREQILILPGVDNSKGEGKYIGRLFYLEKSAKLDWIEPAYRRWCWVGMGRLFGLTLDIYTKM